MRHVAFLGCAHIHVPGFVNMLAKRDDVAVAACYDADRRRSSAWAERTKSKVADSVEAVVSDPKIDAVIVCSETNKHEPLVRAATRAKKHLFVEKPLGRGAADAYAMAREINDAGVLFQTGYFQRSDPKNRFIKSLIDAGALGRITRVGGSNAHTGALGDWFKRRPDAPHEDWHWMTDPAAAGVGAFGDLGTHALDILLWWLGGVSIVTAQLDAVTRTYTCDESGQGLMRFKSGVIGTLAAGWVDRADPVTYFVSGTEGHATIIDGELYVVSQKDERFKQRTKVPADALPPAGPHAFNLFVDAVVGEPLAVPLVTADEAAYRSAVMAAMYKGAATNTWVAPA